MLHFIGSFHVEITVYLSVHSVSFCLEEFDLCSFSIPLLYRQKKNALMLNILSVCKLNSFPKTYRLWIQEQCIFSNCFEIGFVSFENWYEFNNKKYGYVFLFYNSVFINLDLKIQMYNFQCLSEVHFIQNNPIHRHIISFH